MSPRPLYFIARPGQKRERNSGLQVEPGPIVPLIPVDQLSEWIEVVGVPRNQPVEHNVDLSNLGTVHWNPNSIQHLIVLLTGRPTAAETPRLRGPPSKSLGNLPFSLPRASSQSQGQRSR